MATAVKSIDPNADVVGPAFWSFHDYYTLQNAPDWSQYSGTYNRYLAMYLDKMHAASVAAGKRLLDVVDVHRLVAAFWLDEPAPQTGIGENSFEPPVITPHWYVVE